MNCICINILLFFIIHFSNSLQIRNCKDCMWYLSNSNSCKLFSKYIEKTGKSIYESVDFCRENDLLCGNNGYFFEYNYDISKKTNKNLYELVNNFEENEQKAYNNYLKYKTIKNISNRYNIYNL